MTAVASDPRCEAAEPAPETRAEETLSIFRAPLARHSRAERRERGDVPWLSTVRLPWGLEVRLLNISSTGLLLESGSKLTPGNVTELRLCGPDTELVLPVRFVRSEIGAVDHVGVTYRTAATFEKALKLLGPARTFSRETSSPATALSHLLARVSGELDRGPHASLRTALERGVRQAVTARSIHIRDVPIAPTDGSESIYFTLTTRVGPPAILQAMFAPGYEPTDLEFKLLKAAAGLAAVVLEFDKDR